MRPIAAANLLPMPTLTEEVARNTDRALMLRHVFLLSGAARPGGFVGSLGCSVLDLPVDADRDLLDLWCERLDAALLPLGVEQSTVHVLCDPRTPLPRYHVRGGPRMRVLMRRDNETFRGTAGALRDAVDRTDAHDDEFALILPAAQYPIHTLSWLIAQATQLEADAVVMCVGHDEPPVGFLIRFGLLRMIRSEGYVDLKEQALALFAAHGRVCVLREPDISPRHIVTRDDYLRALTRATTDEDAVEAASHPHASVQCAGLGGLGMSDLFIDLESVQGGRPAVGASGADPLDQLDGRSRFSIVQPGAVAEDGAVLHDSVALAGSVVHRGAIVARSVLAAGAIVNPGEVVVDRLVTASFRPVAWDI